MLYVTTKRFQWVDRDTAARDLLQLVDSASFLDTTSALKALRGIRSTAIIQDLINIAFDITRNFWERRYALYVLNVTPENLNLAALAPLFDDELERRRKRLVDEKITTMKKGQTFHLFEDTADTILGLFVEHPQNLPWILQSLNKADPLVVCLLLSECSVHVPDMAMAPLIEILMSLLESHPEFLDLHGVIEVYLCKTDRSRKWLEDKFEQIVEMCEKLEQDSLFFLWEWPALREALELRNPSLVKLHEEREQLFAAKRERRKRERLLYKRSPAWKKLLSLHRQAAKGKVEAVYKLSNIVQNSSIEIPVRAAATYFLGKLVIKKRLPEDLYKVTVEQLCTLVNTSQSWTYQEWEYEPIVFEAGEALSYLASPHVWETIVNASLHIHSDELSWDEWIAHLTDMLSGLPDDGIRRTRIFEYRPWIHALGTFQNDFALE